MKLIPGKLYKVKCERIFSIKTDASKTFVQMQKKNSIVLFIEKNEIIKDWFDAYFLDSTGKVVYITLSEKKSPSFHSPGKILELLSLGEKGEK